eukprot:3363160-Amphidinium_carterae.1
MGEASASPSSCNSLQVNSSVDLQGGLRWDSLSAAMLVLSLKHTRMVHASMALLRQRDAFSSASA